MFSVCSGPSGQVYGFADNASFRVFLSYTLSYIRAEYLAVFYGILRKHGYQDLHYNIEYQKDLAKHRFTLGNILLFEKRAAGVCNALRKHSSPR